MYKSAVDTWLTIYIHNKCVILFVNQWNQNVQLILKCLTILTQKYLFENTYT